MILLDPKEDYVIVDINIKAYIGKRLEYFRVKAGITQEELAEKLGYKSGPSMISQAERGLAGMSVEQYIKAAKILNVHPAALISEKDFSNEDIELLSDFLQLLGSDKKQTINIIKTIIKSSD